MVCATCLWRTLGNLLVKASCLVCVEADSVLHLSRQGTWGSEGSVRLAGALSGSLWSQMPEDCSGDAPAYVSRQPRERCEEAARSQLEIQQALTRRSKPSWQREYTLRRLA